jgi:hypothetical protein
VAVARPEEALHTFDHESFPTGYLGEADPEAWKEPRKALGREVLGGAHRLLLVLAALGEDRYHMVVTPALCILAAAALRRPEPQGEASSAQEREQELREDDLGDGGDGKHGRVAAVR